MAAGKKPAKRAGAKHTTKNGDKRVAAARRRGSPAPAQKPAGYHSQSDEDLDGIWDGETPIHMIPISINLSDSKLDSSKPSVLIICELVEPTNLNDGTSADEGAKVGIWGKPGMKKLLGLAGVKCFMTKGGTKDTGKKNPMQLYEIASEKLVGSPLLVTGDYRRDSRNAKTWAVPTAANAPAAASTGRGRKPSDDDDDDGDDGDIPF